MSSSEPPIPLQSSAMRESSPPITKKPSPTATPFVPASSNDVIPSSSFEYAGSARLAALARVNLPPGQIACKFYVKGYCSRGTGCWYMHDAATVAVPMIVEEGGKKKVVEFREPKGKGKATCHIDQETGIVHDLDSAEEGEPCAICFEVPTTYGLLTSCDHVFCLGCIRSWRSSGNKSENAASALSPFGSPDDGNLNKTSKTCPLCRVRSKFIIPSSIFPVPPPGPRPQSSPDNDLSTNPAKEAIVQRYLDKLGTIPCRYFQDSMTRPGACRGMRNIGRKRNDPIVPFCPFGNECHYAHTGSSGEEYAFSDRELSNHRRSRTSRGGRNRTRWMEQMLLGVFSEAERNQHGPLFHANAADAQAMLEILIESHAPDWADHFLDREEEIDEDYLDGDDGYWQDEDDEPDVPAGERVNVMNLMNAMGFGSARQDFHGGVFESGQPHDGRGGDGLPAQNSPRAGGGARETRREDGTLVVELDFFEMGRNSVHAPAEAALRPRRSARDPPVDEDEMPRLVNVDDLD